MFFFTIIFLSILFPLLMEDKKTGFKIAFYLLFILWGCQYDMVIDWPTNLIRWNVANHGVIAYNYRDIEPLFLYILKLAKPLSFFGWLMLCGTIELFLIYKITVKYVNKKYYWMTVFILMLNASHGLLMINSNRQSVSMLFTWGIILSICQDSKDRKKNIFKYLIAFVFYICAINIHTGAYSTILFLFIPLLVYFCNKLNTKLFIIIINVIFFFRFFINYDNLSEIITSVWGVSEENGFDSYLDEFGNVADTQSIFNQSLPFITANIIAITYNRMPKSLKIISLITLLGVLLSGFVTKTLARSFLYFNILQIWVIPCVYNIIEKNKFKNRKYITIVLLYAAMYFIYSFYKNVLYNDYYIKWVNYKSIFEAAKWI